MTSHVGSIRFSEFIMTLKITERVLGQRVLELGAGCGLAGIVAARYAEHVTMTDYLLKVNENIAYNVGLNSKSEEECAAEGDDDDDETPRPPRPRPEHFNMEISKNTAAGFLDWDKIDQPPPPVDQQVRWFLQPRSSNINITCMQCSRLSRNGFSVQRWYKCPQCHTDAGAGCCEACAFVCHGTHGATVRPRDYQAQLDLHTRIVR